MVGRKPHRVVEHFVSQKDAKLKVNRYLNKLLKHKTCTFRKTNIQAKVLIRCKQQEPTRSWDRNIVSCHVRPQAKRDC